MAKDGSVHSSEIQMVSSENGQVDISVDGSVRQHVVVIAGIGRNRSKTSGPLPIIVPPWNELSISRAMILEPEV